MTSETVVTPVQHSHVVPNHPPPPYNQQATYSSLRNHPLYNIPQYNQLPKKYIYVNGKFIYDPSVLNNQQYQSAPSFFHPAQQFPQAPGQFLGKPLAQINYFNSHVPKPNLIPPQPVPVHPPSNKFEPPQKHQLQTINTPSQPPQKPEKQKEVKEEKPVREESNDDERDEKSSSYDDDDYEKFGRYSFDDEEDEDHQGYRYV